MNVSQHHVGSDRGRRRGRKKASIHTHNKRTKKARKKKKKPPTKQRERRRKNTPEEIDPDLDTHTMVTVLKKNGFESWGGPEWRYKTDWRGEEGRTRVSKTMVGVKISARTTSDAVRG